ncbi:DUF1446-domain-containing protein [Aureobasidium sp. EXF-8845]|nr:DUF1446-domain-containing protein [Aureobasidium sp. EXF-8846]KAI4850465.1 DUF1446-domain-containing protein [Aureobasidium sp. EXF-8845]
MPTQRNLRIGNCSGATGDAPHAMARMVKEADVDVITGDWLSEMNIAWESINKAEDPELGYDVGFLRQLTECIDDIAERRIKLITNAGAMNAPVLARKVEELCQSRGHGLVVATILGDDVSHLLKKAESGHRVLEFPHLDHQEQFLKNWDPELEPSCAAAYIGAWGIVAALKEGADIVICGRVTDASPVIGAAAWWYGWSEQAFDQLAGALIAGHLIECGPYATGANFSGFKEFLPELIDLAFPVAEIMPSGDCYITKPDSMNGVVNKFNITSQLLYELQGQMYLNPDVVADVSSVHIEATGRENHVLISGCKGFPPPPTTKVMVAAPGGWQTETTYYINGLDVQAKAQMMKQQLQNIFSGSRFSKFSAELYGTQVDNPSSQQAGTAMLRVFAQARKKEDVAAEKFKTPLYSLRMQSYPGYHMNLDFRTMDPKKFYEIFPATIPQVAINHEALVAGKRISISPPRKTQHYPIQRPSAETLIPIDLSTFGPTECRPLGSIVHARSGDKANNSNVGFFVRHVDEYAWLQSLLTTGKLRELLQDDYDGHDIERCELPNILAVHL